jgi:hydrogenase-4 component E
VSGLLEPLLTLLILVNFLVVGTSRLRFGIRVLAVQGIAAGLLPLLLPGHALGLRDLLLSVMSIALKGFVFPWLLHRALRAAGVRLEAEPLIGFTPSLLLSVFTLGISIWLASRLNPPVPPGHRLLLPTALFTVLTGLFLIVSRKTALNQVMGYLAMENGIFLFGINLARSEPLLVEMGVLLDVFMAVFVMGIAIFHISREFDHIDVDQLSALKD